MDISGGIAVIIGAVIGGGISLIGSWIQQKNQLSRDLIKIAYELAINDFNTTKEWAKPGSLIPPLESFVTYYIKYIKLIKKGKIKIEDLTELRQYRIQLNKFYERELDNTHSD